MTADELREAVARAICLQEGVNPDYLDETGVRLFRFPNRLAQADAAISTVLAALEEPSEGMCRAVEEECLQYGKPIDGYAVDYLAIWSAMFSARKEELTNGH